MLDIVKSIETISSVSSNRHEQLIREKMTDYMAVRITSAEQTYHQCQKRFNQNIEVVWKNHHGSNANQLMPTNLTNLIEKRFTTITDQWRIIYNCRMQCQLNTSSMLIGFGPCMSVHMTHSLTKKQLQLLNRGPTYVTPCQLFSSSSLSSMDDTTKELYGPLKLQLTRLFAKHQVNIALSMNIHTQLWDQFNDAFSKPIPVDLGQRALDEKKVIQSIRQTLQQRQPHLILRRTADDMNTFYLGDRKEFEEKANQFVTKTNIFEFQLLINEKRYGTEWQMDVYRMIESMNYILRRIHEKKGIDDQLLQRLTIEPSTIKLPYLYFLPMITLDNELSVMPIISAYEGPTWFIGRFLDRLLRPLTHRAMKSTTFNDDIDFGHKFYQFCQTGHRSISSNTLFATIHVVNYYTMAPHAVMADVLEHFLRDSLPGNTLEKFSIVHIKNLVQLFLYNNAFVYEENMYTCVKGSPTTIPLTETLANIYLFQWQKKILKEINARQQFFGRHKNDIFFTWNGTYEELQNLLQQIQEHDTNVHQQIAISSKIQYINAYLENRTGHVYSCVDHQPAYLQQYTLPYVVHHPIEEHSNWLRFALVRAVCYCTSVVDFLQERIYLELTCLANGYSLYFVERRVDHFFRYFNANAMRYCQDQKLYERFRTQVFTFVEQQHLMLEKTQRFDDDRKLFHFYYLYEYGPRSQFDESFHRLWMQYFKQHRLFSPERSKIILTTKHQHSLNALLAPPTSRYRTLTAKKP